MLRPSCPRRGHGSLLHVNNTSGILGLTCCGYDTEQSMFNGKLFSEYVRERVIGRKSLRDAAKDCGVSFSVISRIGNGQQPSLKNFVRLCEYMGVSPDTFFSGGLGEK